jgi:hypothetical protein
VIPLFIGLSCIDDIKICGEMQGKAKFSPEPGETEHSTFDGGVADHFRLMYSHKVWSRLRTYIVIQ